MLILGPHIKAWLGPIIYSEHKDKSCTDSHLLRHCHYTQGICDIQNISYFSDSRKIAEQYENIQSAKRKNKYQILFLQKTN